jgi:hypothetical protein
VSACVVNLPAVSYGSLLELLGQISNKFAIRVYSKIGNVQFLLFYISP